MKHILYPAGEVNWKLVRAIWMAPIQRARHHWKIMAKQHPAAAWAIRGIVAANLALFAGMAILLTSISWGAFGKLPTREDLADITTYQASEVLDEDGRLLGRYYLEHRSNVAFENLSDDFVHALLATEDVRFFDHNGVDLRSWGRVFFKTLLGGDESSGGGSTLTQQLAKNLFPRQDYRYASIVINKLREVLIAWRIESLYEKEEIMALYLNTVAFSENTYGIKVAAQRFFNTTPDQLNAEQSAVLVGMLKAPSTYNPVSNQLRALQRRNLVLDLMVKHQYLPQVVSDSLKQEPICLEYRPLNHQEGLATYFREHLRLEVRNLLKNYIKPNGAAYNLYTDGLKIYTTLDADMQAYAEEAVEEHLKKLQRDFEKHLNGKDAWENDTAVYLAKIFSARYRNLRSQGLSPAEIDSVFEIPVDMDVFSWDGRTSRRKMSPMDSIRHYLGFLNAGLLSVEPETGKVKAWVGGIDYKYFQYDHVKSRRQVGSTFKPVVYAQAIKKGIPPCTSTSNVLRTYPQYENWQPKNADEQYGGSYTMEGALTRSLNTITVHMAMRVGPASVAEMAENLGIDGPLPRVPAIALGAVEANLTDMVQVYGTFANRGVRPEPYYIKRIETQEGHVLYDGEAGVDPCGWEQVLSTDQADIMTHMLRSAIDQGTGRRLRFRYKFTHEMAGKTGTSQNHSDGWFIGYTPALVTGVWVGAESPAVRFRDLSLGQGANTALPVFALYTQQLLQDPNLKFYMQTPFPKPSKQASDAVKCAPKPAPKPALEVPAEPAVTAVLQ